MNLKLASLIAAVALSAPFSARAQQLDLPRPSPNAKVTQTAGLTDITVEYSSPAVGGRKIWGALVPYETVWRAGANAATKVTFSKEVTVGTTAVPAGTYAFFVLPKAKGNWTLILSKEANQPGAFDYKQEQDLVRVDVKPDAIPLRERLTYVVSDFTNDAANIDLEWEKVRLRLPVKLGTAAQVAANLKGLEDGAWSPANQAARYELAAKNYGEATKWVDRSLATKEDWQNDWTKAQILAAQGKYPEALALAQKAQDLGAKVTPARQYFAADDIKKALTDWKGKK